MTRPIRLNRRHLPQVIALHHEVVAALPADLVAHETDAFFADHLSRLGRIYGVLEDGRLVAYGVLGLPRPDSPNFGSDHGLSADDLARVAHVDGVAVRPDRRGRHLHRLLIAHRLQEAERLGRSIVLSTAAPGNQPSLANLLACGFTVRALVEKFGGTRYLLRHDLHAPAMPEADEDAPGAGWIDLSDMVEQQARFSTGAFGWRMEGRGGEARLFLAPPRAFATRPTAHPADQGAASTDTPEDRTAPQAETATAAIRHAQAEAIIERHAAWAATGGVLPLPFLDTVAVIAVNLSMVKSLADLFGVPFRRDRTRMVLLSVIGGVMPTGVGAATSAVLARTVPGAALLGMAASSATAIALTRSIGEAYRAHFESGAPIALSARKALGGGTPRPLPV